MSKLFVTLTKIISNKGDLVEIAGPDWKVIERSLAKFQKDEISRIELANDNDSTAFIIFGKKQIPHRNRYPRNNHLYL